MPEEERKFVITLVDVPDLGYSCRIKNPWHGYYLRSYDPDARAGLGEAEFTDQLVDALRFPSFDAARECWYQQSTVMETRVMDDGVERENRPLAVVSIDISQVT